MIAPRMLVGKSTASLQHILLLEPLSSRAVSNAFEHFFCRLAASWALYESQEKMAAVAKKHGIELTFFHGKGGTVGRGGNPALYRAILSHPPNTINGRFRVTEQGEMITQNFGAPAIAERTLDM